MEKHFITVLAYQNMGCNPCLLLDPLLTSQNKNLERGTQSLVYQKISNNTWIFHNLQHNLSNVNLFVLLIINFNSSDRNCPISHIRIFFIYYLAMTSSYLVHAGSFYTVVTKVIFRSLNDFFHCYR